MVIYLSTALILFIFFTVLFFSLYRSQKKKFAKYKNEQIEQEKTHNEFVAIMVHELRSPLSVIRGTCDLVSKEMENLPKEQTFELLQQMKISSEGLLAIVNNLLDLAKLESGKVEMFKQKADLNMLLTEVYNYYLGLAKDRGANLIIDLDQSLVPVSFDKEKLRQVMNNLMSNALKYTEPGDAVLIFSKYKKSFVEITVADTGKGIPDEVKTKLFNKFIQAQEHTKKKEKGTGLGLAIVKGIVEAHKGKIWIENNSPKGAKFIFTLPIS